MVTICTSQHWQTNTVEPWLAICKLSSLNSSPSAPFASSIPPTPRRTFPSGREAQDQAIPRVDPVLVPELSITPLCSDVSVKIHITIKSDRARTYFLPAGIISEVSLLLSLGIVKAVRCVVMIGFKELGEFQ